MMGPDPDMASTDVAYARRQLVSLRHKPPGPGFAWPRCYTPPMSKVCASCGKKPSFGNNRSHSMVATKRRFNPNLQRVRVLLNGVARRAYVCTKCLKAGKVQKAV